MTPLEERIAQGLRREADRLPPFVGLRRPAPRRRRGPLLALASFVLVLGFGGFAGFQYLNNVSESISRGQETIPLVVGSVDIDADPELVTCDGGVPASSDLVAQDESPTAADALAALLERQASDYLWGLHGFVELVRHGSIIGYGIPSEDDSSEFSVVVSVTESPEGWTVDRWESSGC